MTLQRDAASDDLIEAMEENRMCILSKIDQISTEKSAVIYKVPHYLVISANTTGLLKICWKMHGIISN